MRRCWSMPVGGGAQSLLRGLTGALPCLHLSGGMKIAVGWGPRDRGLLVGLLVGGVSLGSGRRI